MIDRVPLKNRKNNVVTPQTIPQGMTFDEFVAFWNNGFFADVLNNNDGTGTMQIGTALNKSTLFSDTASNLLGLTGENANPNGGFEKIMQGGLLNALLTGFAKTEDHGDILSEDTLLKALNKLNNTHGVVSGSYTGDNSNNRLISTNITPKLVVIHDKLQNPPYRVYSLFVKTIVGTTYITTSAIQSATGNITNNGFYVNNTTDDNSNKSNFVYNYIAIW